MEDDCAAFDERKPQHRFQLPCGAKTYTRLVSRVEPRLPSSCSLCDNLIWVRVARITNGITAVIGLHGSKLEIYPNDHPDGGR